MQRDAPREALSQTEPLGLPRGPHNLPRATVVTSQRIRILSAITQAVAKKGYAATTVSDVVGFAGVSRATFYEQFSDKEDCLAAAFDASAEIMLAEMARALEGPGDWRERMRAIVRTYLGLLAAEPAFAQTFLIEVGAAGPRLRAQQVEMNRRFNRFYGDAIALASRQESDLEPVPMDVVAAMIGGFKELISEYIREGHAERLRELEPTIMYIMLRMVASPAEAAAELDRAEHRR